jgi:hypothetical protein
MKNSIDTVGNQSRNLPVCSAVPQPLRHRVPHLQGLDGEKCSLFLNLSERIGYQLYRQISTKALRLLHAMCLVMFRKILTVNSDFSPTSAPIGPSNGRTLLSL